MKYINGMTTDRLDEVWDSNVNGSIQTLVESVASKVSESHPQMIWQTNGYLQIAVFEVAQELMSTYGVIWGRIWRDMGFGILTKENHEWVLTFDKDDEMFLTQSVIDKYKGVA